MELKRRTETLCVLTKNVFSFAPGRACPAVTLTPRAPRSRTNAFLNESSEGAFSAPRVRKSRGEPKPQRYCGFSQPRNAISPAMPAQPLSEAATWRGAAIVEQRIPKARKAPKTKTTKLFGGCFITWRILTFFDAISSRLRLFDERSPRCYGLPDLRPARGAKAGQ